MAIAITDAHRELAGIAESFAQRHGVRAAARAMLDAETESLPAFWGDMAELGWLGLHVAEELGGSGYGLAELVVVLEQMGRVAAPGPLLPTVLASAVIDRAGSEEQRHSLVPSLVDGSTTAGVALGGTVRVGDRVVDGEAVVLAGGVADVVVVVAGDDVVVARRGVPGLGLDPAQSLDPTRRSARARFASVSVGDLEVLPGAADAASALARTLVAAEACGVAREALDMATEYAKQRKQFGRVIGTFGPVKHHCANMLVAAECATALAWEAGRAAGSDPGPFSLAAAEAAAVAVPAAVGNSKLNIQVHGGIGFTWEHDAHIYLRRAGTLQAFVDPGRAAADVTDLVAGGVQHDRVFDLPPEAEAIRAEVAPIVAELAVLPADQQRSRLIDTGLVQPHWPRPWGRAAGALEQLVIEDELSRAGLRIPNYGITGWVALTLVQHATQDQVDRWIRATLDGTVSWCQLFSEPDAGSDAAGITTRGTRVEGGWLVNGSKIWTSGAQHTQLGLATVRTDPDAPKHQGITTMAIDMAAEGVDIRPLREASGGAMFNAIFFDDVFVPDDDVVGEVNAGWTVARATLGNERVSIGGNAAGPGRTPGLVQAWAERRDQLPGLDRRIGAHLAQGSAMVAMNLRRAERAVLGSGPGPEGNVTKLLSAEQAQAEADLSMEVFGTEAALADGEAGPAVANFVFSRALSIAGGTSEISRNQIGERILGLPRDPLVN